MPPVEDTAELVAEWAKAEEYAATRPDPVAENDHIEQAKGRDEQGRFTKGKDDGQAKVAQRAEPQSPEVAADAVPANGGKAKGSAVREKPADAADDGGETADARGVHGGRDDAPGLAELRELAKKHGFTVEDGKVLPRERHAFREERRAARQKDQERYAAERSDFDRQVQQFHAQAGGVLEAARRAQSGDWDGFAAALGAKDWNDLNGRVISQFADPNYKRTLELEQKLRDREAIEQRQQQESVRVQQAQREVQAANQYRGQLAEQMASSSDPFVAAMHDDPSFVNAIYQIQREHFDGYETISPEEAVKLKPRNGGSPLLEQLRTLYFRLDKAGIFRAESSSPSAASSEPPKGGGPRAAQSPAKQAGKTSISQKDAAEAAGVRQFKDDQEFIKYGARLLEEAQAEERKSRSA